MEDRRWKTEALKLLTSDNRLFISMFITSTHPKRYRALNIFQTGTDQ